MMLDSEFCNVGADCHNLAKELFPLCRSITGNGVRKSLELLRKIIPELRVGEYPTGMKCFDWAIPKEWNLREAYILTPSGRKICDASVNNLHIVSYSVPFRAEMPLAELKKYLHSLPDMPTAIPYVTSYYKERWGFCISHKELLNLEDGVYRVFIDSSLEDGAMTYGELLIKGESDQEILLSTYICHPSMANNELSGIVVTAYLAKWILELKKTKYSYRIIFIPETIGSIAYISQNLDRLKRLTIAGFNISCVGDDRAYSCLPSRMGNTLSDRVAKHILSCVDPGYRLYGWSDRGSDERQYCSPGVDLPIASMMRTRFGDYPEYHTSLDDLVNVVTPEGLAGGFRVLQLAIEALEKNCTPAAINLCEPQLSRRNLYPDLSNARKEHDAALLMNLLTWSDGSHDLIAIADKSGVPVWELYGLVDTCVREGLIRIT